MIKKKKERAWSVTNQDKNKLEIKNKNTSIETTKWRNENNQNIILFRDFRK